MDLEKGDIALVNTIFADYIGEVLEDNSEKIVFVNGTVLYKKRSQGDSEYKVVEPLPEGKHPFVIRNDNIGSLPILKDSYYWNLYYSFKWI